ncbi:WxL domain-containing protein [Arthrobacter wenxiniae]|uniref:WxL domain-containing protein n=1 Tax=Arthrobacter wenxiniae TaxID=2713570 RepID=A0A7Y7IIH3_9MICC|nr:WxL domain-containing protein [Arthrobacter wenxiniae]NVM96065.1 hypothetical protein [Arthrobacter wenxiniae]
MFRFSTRKTAAALAVATLTTGVLFVAPSAFAADSVSQSVTGGSLTATVADLGLAPVVTAHTDQVATGTMTLSADDSTGTGAGWNVTEQVSDFIYSGPAGGTNIPATAFSITSVGAVTSSAGQAIDVAGTDAVPTGPQSANITTGVSGSLATAVKVITAGANYGSGTYSQPINVALTIPADSRVGTYTGTLTTSMTAAP